ncbi:hypothetical protein A2972_02325 [Candidatus Amesbacteria bacterium RIFCSPLOWO2_01_FULL_47_33]|uniref:Uncharacterized protein n=4 Tax=Candidatus Amesiibacteriota TaxID=1752730 RepID=A0A1F4Z2C1_9BACT|nr:MAG: hypothetical protein A2972_02325 [Candidatus Amesbacteria bacterium RIFCSPLOWO2_01_FULL_47_33]
MPAKHKSPSVPKKQVRITHIMSTPREKEAGARKVYNWLLALGYPEKKARKWTDEELDHALADKSKNGGFFVALYWEHQLGIAYTPRGRRAKKTLISIAQAPEKFSRDDRLLAHELENKK